MLIDCDTCRVRGIDCADCVISLLIDRPASYADLTESETAAFAALAEGGLAPPLRLVPVYALDKRYGSASGGPTGSDTADRSGPRSRAG